MTHVTAPSLMGVNPYRYAYVRARNVGKGDLCHIRHTHVGKGIWAFPAPRSPDSGHSDTPKKGLEPPLPGSR